MKKMIGTLRNIALVSLATSTLALAAPAEPTDSAFLKVGNLVFISGQGTGSTKEPDPTGAAIEEALQKIRALVQEAGGEMSDVVKLTVYAADLNNDYPLLNQVVPKYFKKPYPTRSTVGVANLPKDHRIEIDAVLVLKN